MPRVRLDVLVIHCGGNDLCPNCNQTVLEEYIKKFIDRALIVNFCSVVNRTQPRGVSAEEYKWLATEFNRHLSERLTGLPQHIFWSHHHLDRASCRADDGVHLNSVGLKRFGLSLRKAIIKALNL